jgi:hypothetical protein
MGFWKTVGGIALAAGGIAAAGATGGASLSLVGVGASMVGNSVKEDAAKKAAKQAIAAGDKAIATQQAAAQQAGQAYSPYTQQGQQAVNTIGSLMGFAPSSGTAPPGSSGIGAMPTGMQQAVGARPVAEMPTGGTSQAVPRGPEPLEAAARQTQSTYQPMASLGGASTVRMRAPDGEVAMIPMTQVNHYRQLGAEVLS